MRIALLWIVLVAIAVVVGSTLRSSQPAMALHHFSEISEVLSGFDNGNGNINANIQYVEINQRSLSQNFVGNTRLTAWDATGNFIGVLLTVPAGSTVSNSGNGVKWIMGTAAFEAASGIEADFEFPPTPGLPAAGGMVCWGAPGVSSDTPPPELWDETDPNNYVDCVAYGSFSGTTPNIPPYPTVYTNTPTALGPGDCERSLTRTIGTTFNLPNPPPALPPNGT